MAAVEEEAGAGAGEGGTGQGRGEGRLPTDEEGRAPETAGGGPDQGLDLDPKRLNSVCSEFCWHSKCGKLICFLSFFVTKKNFLHQKLDL